jgi:hypothetical protein
MELFIEAFLGSFSRENDAFFRKLVIELFMELFYGIFCINRAFSEFSKFRKYDKKS